MFARYRPPIDTKSIEKYQNRYSTAAKQLKELPDGRDRSVAALFTSCPGRSALSLATAKRRTVLRLTPPSTLSPLPRVLFVRMALFRVQTLRPEETVAFGPETAGPFVL